MDSYDYHTQVMGQIELCRRDMAETAVSARENLRLAEQILAKLEGGGEAHPASAVPDPAPDYVGPDPKTIGLSVLRVLSQIPVPSNRHVAVTLLVSEVDGRPVLNTVRVGPTTDVSALEEGGPVYPELLGLWETVVDFRDRHEITCDETVHQTDRVAEAATTFISDVLGLVGYGSYDDEANGGAGAYSGGIKTREFPSD